MSHTRRTTVTTRMGELQRFERELPCCMCQRAVKVAARTTLNPEAPEMLRPSPGAWIGMTLDPSTGKADLVACCGDGCLGNLLSH